MNFSEKVISLTISLLPREQNTEYQSVMISKLREEYEKKAFENFGIIDKVISIEKITHEEMMQIIPTVHFIIDTKVKLYLPKVEDQLTLPISKILSCGIFLETDCFRALVSSMPSSYCLEKTGNSLQFRNKNLGKILKENDLLSFVIKNIRFEKNSFHCLVDIVV